MKNLSLKGIGFFILLGLFFAFRTAPSCSVSYNGIYAFKLDKEHSAVIRFYEDGTVLASTSVNDYMDVFTWFHKENQEMVLNGKYRIKKCGLSFNVSGVSGEQYYTGKISEGSIRFRITDKETKKTTSRTYTFYAL